MTGDGRQYPARPIVGVGGIVVDAQGRVLLVKRRNEPLAGRWSLPGGIVELGEALEAAIRREVREETGLDVRVGPLVEVVQRVHRDAAGRVEWHYVLLDYLCWPEAGVPAAPALRRGRSYESLDQIKVVDHRTGEVKAQVSTVNAGILRKDLQRIGESRAALRRFTTAQLVELSAKAGDLFLNGTLPLGDKGHTQSARDYLETLSATSGLPHVMVRRNMEKIHHALTHMSTVLTGLTRGLNLSILDRGYGEQFGTRISYYPTTQALGLVMPSNSPAVNSLWLPAIPLKTPVIIKPASMQDDEGRS